MRGSLKDIIFDDFLKDIDSIELKKSIYICKGEKTKLCLLIIDTKEYNYYRKIEITEEEYEMLEKGIISLWEQ